MNSRLGLKKATRWFAAGEGFLKAMELLSDGTFKLFVFLCLKADRRTATYHASFDQLASAIRMPRIMIERRLAELQAKRVCIIASGHKPGLDVDVRIEEEFWPYQSPSGLSSGPHTSDYVSAIRKHFLALGCTSGRFGTVEEAQAKSLEERGIPLDVVRDAMIMGACRKFVSWLNNGYSAPISSVSYFESVIGEFLRCTPPADYREFLPVELKRLAAHWSRKLRQQRPIDPAVSRSRQRDQQSDGGIWDDARPSS